MNYIKIQSSIGFVILLTCLLFIPSCQKEQTATENQTSSEQKITVQQKDEIKMVKPQLAFSEFAKLFIEEAIISEENFLKYSADKVNGKNPSQAYKTFKSCSGLNPQIQEGRITYVKRSVSGESGDPIKHVYKLIFKKNRDGEWKLTTLSYKYDLDMGG